MTWTETTYDCSAPPNLARFCTMTVNAEAYADVEIRPLVCPFASIN